MASIVNDSPKQKGLYLLAAVGQAASFVLVQPFAIRILSPIEWGRVSLTMSIIAIALVAITAGLPMTLGTTYFSGTNGVKMARQVNGFGSIVSLALGTIAIVCYAAVAHITEIPLDALACFAIAAIALHGITQLSLSFLRSEGRAGWYVIVLLLATSVGHFAGLAAIEFWHATAAAYVGVFTVCVLAAASIGLTLTKPKRFSVRSENIIGAVRTSIPVAPHAIGLIVMQQGETVLIAITCGAALAGKYNAVMPFALGAIAIVLALGNVWQTVLLSLQGDGSDIRNSRTQAEANIIATTLVLCGSFLASTVTQLLVSSPTAEQIQVARVLPLTALGYTAFLIASAQLFAIKRTKSFAIVTPLIALVMFCFMVYPASHGQLIELSVVKVIGYLVLGFGYSFAAWRHSRSLMQFKPLVLGTLVGVSATALNLCIPVDISWQVISSVISVFAALAGGAILIRRRGSRVPRSL